MNQQQNQIKYLSSHMQTKQMNLLSHSRKKCVDGYAPQILQKSMSADRTCREKRWPLGCSSATVSQRPWGIKASGARVQRRRSPDASSQEHNDFLAQMAHPPRRRCQLIGIEELAPGLLSEPPSQLAPLLRTSLKSSSAMSMSTRSSSTGDDLRWPWTTVLPSTCVLPRPPSRDPWGGHPWSTRSSRGWGWGKWKRKKSSGGDEWVGAVWGKEMIRWEGSGSRRGCGLNVLTHVSPAKSVHSYHPAQSFVFCWVPCNFCGFFKMKWCHHVILFQFYQMKWNDVCQTSSKKEV
jgi:hypothetical protein